MVQNRSTTKRQIIGQISQLFDPLGLLTPIIIEAKLVIQDLWSLKLDWDDQVPDQLLHRWNSFVQELPSIDRIAIPRHVRQSKTFEIHVFADASEKAYGAAVYVRSSTDKVFVTKLLTSKSKVAPLRKMTVPRLELCAAVLAVKLFLKIVSSFKQFKYHYFFWSDSMVVLHWIRKSPAELKTFVANRVAYIQLHTTPSQWQYVPSSENPADLLTRGKTPDQLNDSNIWWNGPHFLTMQKSEWPQHTIDQSNSKLDAELRNVTLLTYSSLVEDFSRISSLMKLKRIIARCRRWLPRYISKRNDPLTHEELSTAELAIVRIIQHETFTEEIRRLKLNQPLPERSQIYKLNPKLDHNSILRIQGRLMSADSLPGDVRQPAILPKHHVARMILESYHQRYLHCGTEQLLHNLRQQYWPTFGRNYVKQIMKRCLICTKFRSKPFDYIMGHLPVERVTETHRPFVHTGIDYCGPFTIKSHKGKGRIRIDKTYIALFVCLTTKAIHLELVMDLTTEAFLACLTRFTNRRGLCHTLHSDNATTFVGANNSLKQLQDFLIKTQPELTRYVEERGIHWKFIPPRSPHFGGIWEANIKSMKSHLYKITHGTTLTYDEMYTLMTSIEACLNSRPLTPISSDPSDTTALTPSHFLIGDLLLQPLESNLISVPSNRVSRWKLIQQMRQHFWQRWSKEYLHQLQTRAKWHKGHPNVQPGTMVLLIDDNAPPLQWNIGRVTQTFPGEDGVVRVVEVKTRSGVFKRSTKRLCPLLVDN